MPLPSGVESVTLNGGTNGLRSPDGTARAGTVTLTPSVDRVVSVEHGLIVLGPSNATVDASGGFTLGPIVACDADGFEPSGWTYRVDENFTGQPPRSYSVLLPAATPVVALPSLIEVTASDGTVISVPGGGGTPSSTVVAETSYGQSSTAGVATAYARGDHTHGTPPLPPTGTTAGTYAAGNDTRLSDARTPTGSAGGALSGTYPNPGLAPATIAAFDAAGAAATAQTAAAADATSKVTAHAGAADPHGDRAYANGTFATQSTVSAIDGYLNDALNRVSAIEQGTAFLAGGHFTGPVEMTDTLTVAGYTTLAGGQFNGSFAAFGDMTLYGTDKGFRFRRGGDATDFEGAGTDLVVSVWSGGDFSGTQHSYLRLSADAQNVQIAGKVESVAALYGGAVHTLDPTTGVAGLGAVNGLSNVRIAGRRSAEGAPTSGTWSAGDAVQDAAGAWWLCTAGGTPGTWSGTAVKPWVFDVTASAYGAKGDAKVISDGAITTGTAVLTSPSNGLAGAVIGMYVSVKGAGPTGVTTHIAQVASVQSNGQITLTANAATTVSGAVVIFGTDDTAAIQAAVDAAEAYLTTHTYAQVYLPPRPYIVAGALNTSKSGNGQIVFGPVATAGVKRILEFRGEGDGAAAVRHWEQTVPQYAGSCLISLGVFASTSAQISSINADGNPGVISGPNEGSGYGVAANYSNMMAVIKNLAILTTHSAYGLTYGPATLWGCANAHVENVGYSTAGTVASPSTDYSSPGTFGTGLSVGLMMPAPGNNDHVVAKNISVGGGYTYGIFATEHLLCDRLMVLYCWAGLVVIGNYAGSVGSVHALDIVSASIEACINEVYIYGAGSSGIGPMIYANISTESSTPNIAGQAAHMAAARGTVRWTGLFTESGLTHDNPTGIESINGQAASAVRTVSGTLTARPIDRVLKADASGGGVTVNLPSAAPNPVVYTIIKADSSGNTVTIDPAGAETVNGSATRVLSAQWETVTLRSDGANWIAI